MSKVSIIVPVYNTANKLEKCLESLVNQTMQDIEIVIVNDGSTDNSEKIIMEYQDKYPNIIKYYKKENTGVSDTRNYGLNVAKSEYIMYIDSDDYIDIHTLEKLNKYIENGIEVIKFKLQKVDERGKIIGRFDGPVFEKTTGEEAYTLHRLLEIGKIDDDSIYKKNNEYQGTPIDADIIIVDEVSMVDMFIMSYLLDCIYKGTKLILVGDSDQLPSVGPGSVLQDIIKSEQIKTVHLDKVFRQAARSKIIVNAHRVNNGEEFIKKEETEIEEDEKNDFFFIRENNQERILEQVLSLCNGRLKRFGNYDFFENIQVLSPTKKGTLGTKELNKALQQELNPHREGENEKSSMGAIFRIGDKVMQIKNNYDIQWERREGNSLELGNGIFNGETGIITEINEKEKFIRVKFDDNKTSIYEYNELEQLEHSYCITIHKAQGSEFDVIIMIIPQAAPMLLTRNLLYTGITRAKKLLVVIGNNNIVNYMIKNVDSKKRNTGLQYKIKNQMKS